MLNYRNDFSKFSKGHLASFKNHKRDAYAILKLFIEDEITISNLLTIAHSLFLFFKDIVTTNQDFRF